MLILQSYNQVLAKSLHNRRVRPLHCKKNYDNTPLSYKVTALEMREVAAFSEENYHEHLRRKVLNLLRVNKGSKRMKRNINLIKTLLKN